LLWRRNTLYYPAYESEEITRRAAAGRKLVWQKEHILWIHGLRDPTWIHQPVTDDGIIIYSYFSSFRLENHHLKLLFSFQPPRESSSKFTFSFRLQRESSYFSFTPQRESSSKLLLNFRLKENRYLKDCFSSFPPKKSSSTVTSPTSASQRESSSKVAHNCASKENHLKLLFLPPQRIII
ncbi:hypothetical protein AVEN_116106-1, partial [Araneus ventricosus]